MRDRYYIHRSKWEMYSRDKSGGHDAVRLVWLIINTGNLAWAAKVNFFQEALQRGTHQEHSQDIKAPQHCNLLRHPHRQKRRGKSWSTSAYQKVPNQTLQCHIILQKLVILMYTWHPEHEENYTMDGRLSQLHRHSKDHAIVCFCIYYMS